MLFDILCGYCSKKKNMCNIGNLGGFLGESVSLCCIEHKLLRSGVTI